MPLTHRPGAGSALLQQAGCGGFCRWWQAAFLRGRDLPCVVQAGGAARPRSLAASSGARGPGTQPPNGAREVAAGLDILRLQGPVTGGRGLALHVPAVHCPSLPAGAAGFRAFRPVPHDPLRGQHWLDDIG